MNSVDGPAPGTLGVDGGPMSDSFRGEATVRLGDRPFVLTVRLSGRFEPVDGRYRWAGRVQPDDELLAAFRAGRRDATVLITGRAAVPARLGEPDPWGGLRVSGAGTPPWRLAPRA